MTLQYALKVFQTEDHFDFRTIERDGEPWFVLADVCRCLDIRNPSDAAARLDEDEKMTLALTEGQSGVRGGARSMTIISESGLYSLTVRSDKPQAKRLRKWVTAEVLPSIRKTGGYGGRVPAFIKRFNVNWDRVEAGHFSVINELVVRLWGRLEMAGYVLPDKGIDGKEIRPDISVGRRFAQWLRDTRPEAANDHSMYVHSTPETDVLARQYPLAMLPAYLEFIEKIWIPECAEDYFASRAPDALPYLPILLPRPDKPKAGMMTTPTLRKITRRGKP